jgi:glycerol-3-phosphate dehydrogenase
VKRNLVQLTSNIYDLLVIGGGIYGAWVAWDATLRGLSVALVDKGDFGSATSSNSLKIIHGGFRYLQHGDFRRMRESIGERRNLMRVAPHLVHPLPVLIPTYGHWMQRKELLTLALAMNDLIGVDRNWGNDPQKYIPRGGHFPGKRCCNGYRRSRRRVLPGESFSTMPRFTTQKGFSSRFCGLRQELAQNWRITSK